MAIDSLHGPSAHSALACNGISAIFSSLGVVSDRLLGLSIIGSSRLVEFSITVSRRSHMVKSGNSDGKKCHFGRLYGAENRISSATFLGDERY